MENQKQIKLCNDFMKKKCTRQNCKFVHNPNICRGWYHGKCEKKEGECKYLHCFADLNDPVNNKFKNNDIKDKNHINKKEVKVQIKVQVNQVKENKDQVKENKDQVKENKDQVKENKDQVKENKDKRDRKDKRDNREKRKRPANTETFEPNYNPADMRVLFEYGKPKTEINMQVNDVVIVPDLFCKPDDMTLYNNLLKEIFATKFDKQELVKPWHGDTHLIVDDHFDWKKYCPTFNKIIEKIADYFNMDIKATRCNWMQLDTDWKPYHHDAAAVKKDKAATQNFTVGVSLGFTREIAFEVANHDTCRNVISFPLVNGTTYTFARDININWKHGVPPIKDINMGDQDKMGRISIIAWGWNKQKEVK